MNVGPLAQVAGSIPTDVWFMLAGAILILCTGFTVSLILKAWFSRPIKPAIQQQRPSVSGEPRSDATILSERMSDIKTRRFAPPMRAISATGNLTDQKRLDVNANLPGGISVKTPATQAFINASKRAGTPSDVIQGMQRELDQHDEESQADLKEPTNDYKGQLRRTPGPRRTAKEPRHYQRRQDPEMFGRRGLTEEKEDKE